MTDQDGTGIRWGTVAFDTPDPRGLAQFYAAVLGWVVDPDEDDDDWVTLKGPKGEELAFQLAPDLVPPDWPVGSVPQQAHLDLYVDSYDETEPLVLTLGASVLDASENHPTFRVYADPSGHPFCLCIRAAVSGG